MASPNFQSLRNSYGFLRLSKQHARKVGQCPREVAAQTVADRWPMKDRRSPPKPQAADIRPLHLLVVYGERHIASTPILFTRDQSPGIRMLMLNVKMAGPASLRSIYWKQQEQMLRRLIEISPRGGRLLKIEGGKGNLDLPFLKTTRTRRSGERNVSGLAPDREGQILNAVGSPIQTAVIKT